MWTSSLVVLATVAGVAAGLGHGGGLPFFELGSINVGLTLQWFGILVASGVLIGAELARRYGDKFGVDDEDMRGMTAWVVVTGFIGAHVFDVLAYQQDKLAEDPLLLLMLWKGISSYGGFIGGGIGFLTFIRLRRLRLGLWADITGLGLLIGFTMGRLGCTVVHDHMGRVTSAWSGVDYPLREVLERHPLDAYPDLKGMALDTTVRIHNLGLYELVYLLPVCAIIVWLAFRSRPSPAGLMGVVIGVMYAPVRFFLDFLRNNDTDPRYAGLTFAQWASIAAFGIAVYAMVQVIRRGKPAPRVGELGPGEVGGRVPGAPRTLTRAMIREAEREARKNGKGS